MLLYERCAAQIDRDTKRIHSNSDYQLSFPYFLCPLEKCMSSIASCKGRITLQLYMYHVTLCFGVSLSKCKSKVNGKR